MSTNFETALAGLPYRNYSVYMMHCWCYIRARNPSQTVAIYPTEVETFSGKCRLTTPKCFAQHGNRNTTLKTQNRAYESTHICTMGPSRSAKLDPTKRKETEKCERGLDGRLCRRRDKCSRTRPFLGATGFLRRKQSSHAYATETIEDIQKKTKTRRDERDDNNSNNV